MHSCTSERRLDEAIHFFDQANDILKDDFTANVKENECPQVITTFYCLTVLCLVLHYKFLRIIAGVNS